MTDRLQQAYLRACKYFERPPEVTLSWAESLHWSDGDECWAMWQKFNGAHFVAVHRPLVRAPMYVLEYLLMHELLHIVLPPRGKCAHHRAFCTAEYMCPVTARARAWLDRRA